MTVVNPGVGVQPLVAFEPLPDPVLTAEGSESEGSSGFALSPSQFPAGLNHGVFIGFHGLFDQGGIANDENPLVFADPSTGHYFDFVSNNLSNIGHLDEILSTSDSLFLADISSSGELFGPSGPADGKIYQIEVIAHSAAVRPISTHSGAVPPLDHGMGVLHWTKSKAASASHQHRPTGALAAASTRSSLLGRRDTDKAKRMSELGHSDLGPLFVKQILAVEPVAEVTRDIMPCRS